MPRERQYTVEDRSEVIERLVDKANESGFTPLQEHFGEWVTDQAAPEFKTAKELDAFRLGAKFALVLRMEHQRSPENHAFRAERSTKQDEVAEAKAVRPARGRKAAPVEDEPTAAPRRRGRPPRRPQPLPRRWRRRPRPLVVAGVRAPRRTAPASAPLGVRQRPAARAARRGVPPRPSPTSEGWSPHPSR
jgi:hypothetical protein